jgi:hypothetical protein
MNIYSNFIHNCQNLEVSEIITWKFFIGWVDMVAHPDNVILIKANEECRLTKRNDRVKKLLSEKKSNCMMHFNCFVYHAGDWTQGLVLLHMWSTIDLHPSHI